MKKKKIAFITSTPSIVLAFLQNHIKELSKQYDVYVISNVKGSKEKKNLAIIIDDNVYQDIKDFGTYIHLGITRRISILNDFKTIFSLINIFRKNHFDSVHSITSKVGVMVMIAALVSRIKHRFHTYTGQVWANKKGFPHRIFKLMDKLIALLSTKCYADSRTQMSFLINENVIGKNKISVLGEGSISGVDMNRFYPDFNTRKTMRDKLLFQNDEIVFLLLCRLTRDKGVLDIAHAFSKIVNEINCKLLIVGPDEDNLIDEIISIVGISFKSKLSFHGYTKCHEKFLNGSDILCLPSYREGFGSIIIDAAATKIPAIGSDIYGIRDAILDKVTGILHKPGDINGIYSAMSRLAGNKNLREKMGSAAFLRVKDKFTMDKISSEWIKEYDQQLNK